MPLNNIAERAHYTVTMEVIEFEAVPDKEGTIVVPEAFREKVVGKKIKVRLSYEDESTAKPPEHYTKGYDQKDSLYDTY